MPIMHPFRNYTARTTNKRSAKILRFERSTKQGGKGVWNCDTTVYFFIGQELDVRRLLGGVSLEGVKVPKENEEGVPLRQLDNPFFSRAAVA